MRSGRNPSVGEGRKHNTSFSKAQRAQSRSNAGGIIRGRSHEPIPCKAPKEGVSPTLRWSTASYCCNYQKGFIAACNCDRQSQFGGLMRQILAASEESDERPPLSRNGVSKSPLERRIPLLECVENRLLRCFARNVEFHLSIGSSQRAEVVGKSHTNHGRVCTSTDSTGGRSWTIACQLSPESEETYICPPEVPK